MGGIAIFALAADYVLVYFVERRAMRYLPQKYFKSRSEVAEKQHKTVLKKVDVEPTAGFSFVEDELRQDAEERAIENSSEDAAHDERKFLAESRGKGKKKDLVLDVDLLQKEQKRLRAKSLAARVNANESSPLLSVKK